MTENPMYEPVKSTAEEVRAYRDEHGSGLIQAKRIFERDNVMQMLLFVKDSGTVEDKVNWLLARYEEDLWRQIEAAKGF